MSETRHEPGRRRAELRCPRGGRRLGCCLDGEGLWLWCRREERYHGVSWEELNVTLRAFGVEVVPVRSG